MKGPIGVFWMLALGCSTAWAEPTVDELLNATDDVLRGDSSVATIAMQVKTARYERTMVMQAWSEGTEHSLIRILEPAKDAGISTLKVEDNIWNYLPKVDRTMKVPAAMMSGSWMGSHFSNDDLVKESRLSEDFDATITARPADNPEGHYVVELVAKPDAAIVWGKVIVRVTGDILPVDVSYFDERGELVRTMSFLDLKEVDGRTIPLTMRLIPADKEGEFTEIRYREIDFDVELPTNTFSLQSLKR